MVVTKIGLLGGTFDPIHHGHLNLAFELMEKKHLHQVWFIPAHISPFKLQTPPTPIEHRLTMTQLAIQEIPQFHLKDLEKNRPPPSYTIQTLKALIAEEASNLTPSQFYLLMGEDSVPGFFDWHSSEEIARLIPLLIGSRTGIWQCEWENFSWIVRQAIQKGLTSTRLMDISSHEIRHRLSQKLYCGHLLPLPVMDYIKQNQLYSFK